MAQTYYNYTYNGTNNFTSPLFDNSLSEIRAYVNTIEVTFTFFDVSNTAIVLDIIPNTGDIVEVLRVTKIDTRAVDYTNGSILREEVLDLDSNQMFYLAQEAIGNNERSSFLIRFLDTNNFNNNLDGTINNLQLFADIYDNKDFTSVGTLTDITNFNKHLSANDTTVQKSLDTIQSLDIAIDGNYIHTDNNFTTILLDKLNAIESLSEVNQTDAEIKIQYELNANTNEFNDIEKLKLSNIEDNAKDDQIASEVVVDSSLFGGNLSITDDTLQKVSDALDQLTFSDAGLISIDTTQFNNRLSSLDTSVQKSFNTLDDYVITDNNFTTILLDKLNAIESLSEVNQTDAEIKIQYELNANTNEFNDTEKLKLSNIEDNATYILGYTGNLSNDNTSIGSLALTNVTTGTRNVAIGLNSSNANLAGSYNSSLGYNSLYNNSASNNTAIGESSLLENTTGGDNVAIGRNSLNKNIDGLGNTAVGTSASLNNTTGILNVSIGFESAYSNTTGGDNVAIGRRALFSNLSTTGLTAVGHNAMYYTTGIYNTGIGFYCLFNNTIGYSNTSIGYESMKLNTASSRNTSIGTRSLYSLNETVATENNNVSIGFASMYYTTTGLYNTSVGTESLFYNTTGTLNTSLGFKSLNKNTISSDNTAIGGYSLFSNSSTNYPESTYNTALGRSSGYNNTIGYSNTFVGALTGTTSSAAFFNSTFLGNKADVTGSNQVQLGDSSTTTYAYGAVIDRSDRRDKTDIIDNPLGLEFINKIKPVQFKWDFREDYYNEVEKEIKSTKIELDEKGNEIEVIEIDKVTEKEYYKPDGSKKRSRSHNGVIAQQVKEVMDEMNVDFAGYKDASIDGGKDVLSIGYEEFISPIIKSIQELTKQNIELKNRISVLENL